MLQVYLYLPGRIKGLFGLDFFCCFCLIRGKKKEKGEILDLIDITWYLTKMRRFLKRGNFSPFSCHRDAPWPPKAAHTNHTCIRSDHLHLEVLHCTFCSLQNILSLHAISTWSPIVWTGVMTARGHGNTVEGSSPIKKAFRFINQQRQRKKITKSR